MEHTGRFLSWSALDVAPVTHLFTIVLLAIRDDST